MPRETVYGIQHVPYETLTTDAPVGSDPPPEPAFKESVPVIDVMWNREGGYVQLVSKATDSHGGRLVEDDGVHYTDGMYVDLDRDAINKLVRNLRRARDQAFGRDE